MELAHAWPKNLLTLRAYYQVLDGVGMPFEARLAYHPPRPIKAVKPLGARGPSEELSAAVSVVSPLSYSSHIYR